MILNMKLKTISAAILAGLALLPVQSIAQSAFTNVTILPMDGRGAIEGQTVVVDGDRIISVASEIPNDLPEKTMVIDGTNKFLMPGLGEMHGHIPPISQGDQAVNDTLFLYLSNGVTTVRGMLGSDGQLALRDDALSGERLSPTLYLAGPSFNGNSVSSPKQAVQKVDQQVDDGWDLLKVHPGLTKDEYLAMADQAIASNIDFAGHVPEAVGLLTALEKRQRTLDHLDGYISYLDGFDKEISDEAMREIARATKQAGVGVVPTSALWATLIGATPLDHLTQFDELKFIRKQVVNQWKSRIGFLAQGNPEIHQQNRRRLLAILQEEGVEILFGTDAPQLFSVPGFSIHHEIEEMMAAGMTEDQILKSATFSIGKYFEDKDTFGTIAPGMRADLILLDDNPLNDVNILKSPSGVMVRGQWISRKEIDRELAAIEARAK